MSGEVSHVGRSVSGSDSRCHAGGRGKAPLSACSYRLLHVKLF